MKRAGIAIAMAVVAITGCASVEDRDCRRTADILEDPSHYRICLIQKGKA